MGAKLDFDLIYSLNLFSKITRVRTKNCFRYNNWLIFVVPPQIVPKALGQKGENVQKIGRLLKCKVKVIPESSMEPFVKAIVFYGSRAKGLNKPDSDIDILLFTPLRAEEEYTKGEYFYKFNNYEINIVLRSIERLRKLAVEKDDFQRGVFRDCEIIWEKDNEVKELIKKIII